MPISHRFEAGADVCSTEHRVGPLNPPLQMEALSACEEIMSLSIAVWPQSTNVTDDRRRQTDRPVAIPTHWLPSHESAKTQNIKLSAMSEEHSLVATRSPAIAGVADSWHQINLLGGQGHRIKLGVRCKHDFHLSSMRRHMRFSIS